MRFFITPSHNADLDKYLKKDEYKTCRHDLCDFFSGKSCDVIISSPRLITVNDSFYFIKSRIQNSSFNKGKSGGYRLYFYADAKEEKVYIIGYYPKSGKYGREDLTDTELKIAIKTFAATKEDNTLLELDINKHFSIKQPNTDEVADGLVTSKIPSAQEKS